MEKIISDKTSVMEETISDGIPVLVKKGEELRTINIVFKNKKRGRYAPLSTMTPMQKKALENYQKGGCALGTKTQSAIDAGYAPSGASNIMNRILAREEIIKAIEEKCPKGSADKIATVLVEGMDAIHPLAKGEKADHMARISASKELNKIKGVYPASKIEVEERKMVLHLTPSDAIAMEKFKRLRNEPRPDPI